MLFQYNDTLNLKDTIFYHEYTDFYNPPHSALVKLDEKGDFKKALDIYTENIDGLGSRVTVLPKDFVVDNNQNLYLLLLPTTDAVVNGNLYILDSLNSLNLIKFNSDFDLFWSKPIPPNFGFYNYGMNIRDDGNISMSLEFIDDMGMSDSKNALSGISNLTVDTAGNVLKRKEIIGRFSDVRVDMLEDGTICLLGQCKDSILLKMNLYYQVIHLYIKRMLLLSSREKY